MISNFTFNLIKQKDLNNILKVRNQKSIRNASHNKKKILIKEHLLWFKKKKKIKFFHHYLLIHNKKFIGVGYGENFKKDKKSCLWGFYVNSKIKTDVKYGSIIKFLLFEKLFSLNKISYIKCQVLKNYEWIMDWHIRWGHKLESYNKKKKCYDLILSKKIWKEIRKEIYKTNI